MIAGCESIAEIHVETPPQPRRWVRYWAWDRMIIDCVKGVQIRMRSDSALLNRCSYRIDWQWVEGSCTSLYWIGAFDDVMELRRLLQSNAFPVECVKAV